MAKHYYHNYPSIHAGLSWKSKGDIGSWGKTKKVAGASKTVATLGVGATQALNASPQLIQIASKLGLGALTTANGVKSTTGVIGALATGATVSTGGVALAAAAVAATLVDGGFSAKSAYKTHKHIRGLQAIAESPPRICTGCRDEHSHIHSTILPYIIKKKSSKRFRKGAVATTLGVGSSLEKLRQGAKSLYKMARSTKGVNRSRHAHFLAKHLVINDCDLAQGIVSELFSYGDMMIIRGLGSRSAALILMEKMKST